MSEVEWREAYTLVDEIRLLERQSVSAPPVLKLALPKPSDDGPFGGDGFRWNGKEYRGLTPRAWKLLNCVWPTRDRSCGFDAASEAVYGDDIGPEDPLAGPRKDANAFFKQCGINLVIKVSGRSRAAHVSLVDKSSSARNRSKTTARRP